MRQQSLRWKGRYRTGFREFVQFCGGGGRRLKLVARTCVVKVKYVLHHMELVVRRLDVYGWRF